MKKKKIIIYIIVIIISGFMFSRIYYYYLYDKNNVILIYYPEIPPKQYAESSQPMELEFYIDDKLIYNIDSMEVYYNGALRKSPIGIHSFTIKINSKVVEKTSFLLLPIRWICVEIIDENNVSVFFCSWKPTFM